MLSENFKVQFSGFEPSEEFRKWVDKLLRETHLKSPSQSFLKATFKKTGGLIEGMIDVSSTVGRFAAKAVDRDFLPLGKKLSDGIVKELDRWKSMRII